MSKPFDAQITFCYTNDLDATAQFYERVLKLPLVLDQRACRIYRVAGSAFIGFCTREESPRPDDVILTFVTDDVDGWHERLTQRGVQFTEPPTLNKQFNIYHCFLRDPTGYLIEIQHFNDPAWSINTQASR